MRFWLSGPRKHVRPRLPSYRREQLRAQLEAGAIARGKAMTSKECDDLIAKAVASGVLDSSGDLNFNMRGSREEIIAGILGRCAAWNMPMTRFSAERLADSALRVIRRCRWLWVMWIAIPLILAMAVLFTIVAARRAILDDETSPSQSLASTMALRYPDCAHIVEGRQRGRPRMEAGRAAG